MIYGHDSLINLKFCNRKLLKQDQKCQSSQLYIKYYLEKLFSNIARRNDSIRLESVKLNEQMVDTTMHK